MSENEMFLKAKTKIEECLQSNNKDLDLENYGLDELPEEIHIRNDIEILNLSGNSLYKLPDYFANLTQLKWLLLSKNNFVSFPEAIKHLTHLEILDLSKNQLKEFPDGIIKKLIKLHKLNLSNNQLTVLPETIGRLHNLVTLDIYDNNISIIPESIGNLSLLKSLDISNNNISELPDRICELNNLELLNIDDNDIKYFPNNFGMLNRLKRLYIGIENGNPIKTLPKSLLEIEDLRVLYCINCQLTDLPEWLVQLNNLQQINIDKNPLNPELSAAYNEGWSAINKYLLAKSEETVSLNEIKLIIIGEGEVGKSCLLSALRGDPWEENRPTTHGIEIKPVKVSHPSKGSEIILNGWDFGGQRVYRPTHQLFFSAPAVYLVVWKPREGHQQGFVKDWIRLIKYREPDAKIIIVATHGGPKERQPDIDRQEMWDIFGEETIVGFYHVDSKPDKTTGERRGITELLNEIANTAVTLPEMGRLFPKKWQLIRNKLIKFNQPYISIKNVFSICHEESIEEEDSRIILRICNRVGDLIWYEHDPTLHNIVILKPDWLATAISFVLDDEYTRRINHGLVDFSHLNLLWNNPSNPPEYRYDFKLHPIFLRLMERFDISYKIAEIDNVEIDGASLIAQLVPDVRPDISNVWNVSPSVGDEQQIQICHIVDSAKNQSATAEGLFYQLIVRLHKYSLGRNDYSQSIHWQRGLILKDDTGALAFLEHIDNDIRITVRSPYPERFLSALTYEVKWLVEYFWKGMRCEITVPCLVRQKDGKQCVGLFDVDKLIENKKRNRYEQPCQICNEWQSIEQLLHNAPTAHQNPTVELLNNYITVKNDLSLLRENLMSRHDQIIGRFDKQDAATRELVSKVESAYENFMRTFLNEAKDGPRLFSLHPINSQIFNKSNRRWIMARFRLTLWCEHSRLPLPLLNINNPNQGVYEFDIPREWFVKAAPYLKIITSIIGLTLPVASSIIKLGIDDSTYKKIEKQLDLGQKSIESVLKGVDTTINMSNKNDSLELEHGNAIEARGATFRQFQSWLKERDPSFGGLVRVKNNRHEFLWVHNQFEKEY